MTDWQPIETAPKRQTKGQQFINVGGYPEIIIGWYGSDRVNVACWLPDREEGGRWVQTNGTPWIQQPDVWQPLPPAPVESE